jgi:peptide/nickel transport system substrate-binding protein
VVLCSAFQLGRARKIAASAIAATLLPLICVVASAMQGAPGRINAWTRPHVLTIADGGDLNTLNPHLGQSAPIANLSEMTMAWLIKWDKRNRPYPELATEVPSKANGGVSRDGRTITYHLRRNVTWSDGAPFDADDVVFSTAVVNNPANDEVGRLDQIVKVDEPDKFTIVYHLKKPYSLASAAFFSSCCANPCLLPKHLLARYPNINHVPYNDLPIGIGPFVFERWDRSRQVVLAANPRYWRGRPKLDKIVYKIVPDRDTLLAQLRTHDVDLWYQFGGAYLARIEQLPGYRVLRQPSYAYDHLDFNLSHRAVADANVRRALRLALDRRTIVDRIEHGVGVVQDSAAPLAAPYFTGGGAVSYDPAKANALLDRVGWTRGPDGIRVKKGVRLELVAAIPAQRRDLDAQLALVRRDWQRVGVALSVRRYPQTLMFAPVQQGGVVYGNSWDITTFAWAADPLGDYSGIYGCRSFPPAGQNNVRWCDASAQAAMDALLGHYEQSQRNADVKVLMRAFVDDVPSIVSFLRVDLFAYNRDLKHYSPNTITPFDNMMDVDI